MTVHYYNGMIKTYAGAVRNKNEGVVKEEVVDAYIKDTWELVKGMENEGIQVNINVMNSIL